MHLDPVMPLITGSALAIVVLGFFLRRMHQPAAVGYLLAGVLLGPFGLALLTDVTSVERLGAIGVVLLLFFVGIEMSAGALAERWKLAVLGTLLQIAGSVGLVALIGLPLGWPAGRVVLIGFAVSISSTAVVFKLLREWREGDSDVARNVTAILIAQDLALIPMLVVLGAFAGEDATPAQTARQVVGAVLFLAVAAWIARRRRLHFPLARWLENDHELQVFLALAACFGLALVSGLLELSAATGAFLAGMLVRATDQTQWVERSLRPFEVVFVAAFFLSVGMLIDLEFLVAEWKTVLLVLGVVFATNTGLNAVVLRLFGCSWRRGLYAGAMLAQIGELSFVLAAVGLRGGIVSEFGYQILICTISLSLLACPAWILLARRFLRPV